MKYDHERFEPSAPVVKIKIKNHWLQDLEESWYALLDTGSDTTAIPTQFLKKLQLKPYTRVEVQSATYDKTKKEFRDKAFVDFEIIDFDFKFNFKSVILLDIEEALIGRDILNHLHLNLNGPANEFEIKP